MKKYFHSFFSFYKKVSEKKVTQNMSLPVKRRLNFSSFNVDEIKKSRPEKGSGEDLMEFHLDGGDTGWCLIILLTFQSVHFCTICILHKHLNEKSGYFCEN